MRPSRDGSPAAAAPRGVAELYAVAGPLPAACPPPTSFDDGPSALAGAWFAFPVACGRRATCE